MWGIRTNDNNRRGRRGVWIPEWTITTGIEAVYEGLKTLNLYFVVENDEGRIEREHNNPVQDLRYRLFGSTKVYKTFFRLLHDDLKNGTLSKELYLIINQIIGQAIDYTKMHPIITVGYLLAGGNILGHYIKTQIPQAPESSVLLSYLGRARGLQL